jgi:transcriptional regulator with XRE-family HTH domain
MATNNLKSTLVREGIKQAELARDSSVSSGTVNKVCNGRLTVAPTTRHRLVGALNRRIGSEKYRTEDIFPGTK